MSDCVQCKYFGYRALLGATTTASCRSAFFPIRVANPNSWCLVQGGWVNAENKESDALIRLVKEHALPLQDGLRVSLSRAGGLVPSRRAVAAASPEVLRTLAGTSLCYSAVPSGA